MASLDYKYEVFFSYKRADQTLHWTKQVLDKLKFWLGQEIPGARIFVDEETIELGDRWPDKLREGLKHSRCMVCVWSPMYFQSNWCVSEWRSFLEREKLLGLKSHRLIAPLRFHDGEHFPEEAQNVQWHDVAPYALTLPVFWQTPRALELEDELKKFVKKLAEIIRYAPPFDAAWPVVEAKGESPPKIELARL